MGAVQCPKCELVQCGVQIRITAVQCANCESVQCAKCELVQRSVQSVNRYSGACKS